MSVSLSEPRVAATLLCRVPLYRLSSIQRNSASADDRIGVADHEIDEWVPAVGGPPVRAGPPDDLSRLVVRFFLVLVVDRFWSLFSSFGFRTVDWFCCA
jgi:hypothetical protein